MSFQNRILKYGTKKADQFTAHPLNPRIHPQFQRQVMEAALKKTGWLAPVIENKRTGYLIDGHERVMQALANNEPVPYVLVDLSEDEEAEALAMFDPIGSLAQYDQENLKTLLAQIETEDVALQQLFSNLGAQYGALDVDDPYAEWQEQNMPDFVSEDQTGVKTLIVHFATLNDVTDFAKLLGQTVTMDTKSIWFPKREKENFKETQWVSDDDES